jgi:hypothetical protein
LNVVIVSDCSNLEDIRVEDIEITLLKVPKVSDDILEKVFIRMGKYKADKFILDISNNMKLDLEVLYDVASQYGYSNVDIILPYEYPSRLIQKAETLFTGVFGCNIIKSSNSSIEVFMTEHLKNSSNSLDFEEMSSLMDMDFNDTAKNNQDNIVIGKQKTFKGNCLIAIAGANKGLGVTHTCLTLSGFLVQEGYRVAVLDFNKLNPMNFDLSFIDKDEVTSLKAKGKCTTIGGVDIYSSNDLDLFSYRRMEYDFIIQDLGSLTEDKDKQKFIIDTILTATKSFIVCSPSFWRLTDVSMVKSVIPQGVSVIAPLASKADVQDLKALVGRVCYVFPQTVPFEVDEKTENICSDMLLDILPEKKKGILRRFFKNA